MSRFMLDQALSPDRATEQAQALLDWVRDLGVLQVQVEFLPKTFRYDVRLELAKKNSTAKLDAVSKR